MPSATPLTFHAPPPPPSSRKDIEMSSAANGTKGTRRDADAAVATGEMKRLSLESRGQGDEMASETSSMSLVRSQSGQSLAKKTVVVHVEVRQAADSSLRRGSVKQLIEAYINETFELLAIGEELEGWREVGVLDAHCERIMVAECSSSSRFPEVKDAKLAIHVYKASKQTSLDSCMIGGGEEEDEGDETVMAATIRDLPSAELDGLWGSLVYPDNVKPNLLSYIYTTLVMSDANVDFNIVTWNRVVLLHGPPGTGKTSLCRALAQKLCIRLSNRYTHGKLIEINSHSLFSKWFSESGKLVQKLFQRVTEAVEEDGGFVVVLIDEVESLTAARAGAMAGTEPSDALRVVNALLTQLDKLKHKKNVLVMSTSNIAHAIDSAFIDRADIKQYIGLPPPEAVYWILCGCLTELMRTGMIGQLILLDWRALDAVRNKPSSDAEHERVRQASLRIAGLADKCQGMSGRTLRRLPVLAHARYVGASIIDDVDLVDGEDAAAPASEIEDWIEAIERVVGDETLQMDRLEQDS